MNVMHAISKTLVIASLSLALALPGLAADDLEQRIVETLTALRTADNPNPPDSPFKPFAIIESLRTDNYVQFRQSKPGTFYIDIPISQQYEVNGVRRTATYLDEETVAVIRSYLTGWNLDIRDITVPGLSPYGGISSNRDLDADVTIDPKDYGKMVMGIFTECYGEKPPLELNIIFEPEG